jgi:hypothetical protein
LGADVKRKLSEAEAARLFSPGGYLLIAIWVALFLHWSLLGFVN